MGRGGIFYSVINWFVKYLLGGFVLLCVSDGAYSNILVNKKMKQLLIAEKKMKLSHSRPCVIKSCPVYLQTYFTPKF